MSSFTFLYMSSFTHIQSSLYFLIGRAVTAHPLCTDINECERPEYPCRGVCRNTLGSYECKCPSRFHSPDPFKDPCNLKFPLGFVIASGTYMSYSFEIYTRSCEVHTLLFPNYRWF